MIGAIAFGSTWRNSTRGRREPLAIAPWIKICSRIDSTTERTRRTTRGISGMVIAMMTVCTLARVSDSIATASRMPGIAISPSITRITSASSRRREPPSRPIVVPMTVARNDTHTPISREICPPYSVRLSTSRP